MNRIRKAASLLLALLLIFSLAACRQTPVETTTAPTETTTAPTETTAAPTETTTPEETTEATEPLSPEEQILAERRDLAESFMRKMLTVLWRANDDILYLEGDLHLVPGRLYSGIPYSFGYCTLDSFLYFASEPDAKGVYPVSGLTYEILSGWPNVRMGNDCSSAFMAAWSQFGTSVTGTRSRHFGTENGFLPVGDYIPAESYEDTFSTETISKTVPVSSSPLIPNCKKLMH